MLSVEEKEVAMYFWEHVQAVREQVQELPPEERERGRRFSSRYWALAHAREALQGEHSFTERRLASIVEHLEEVQQEIWAEFAAWREERGIPAI